LGEDAGSLPVVFKRSDRLTINMATARAIGTYPSWSVINEAVQIKEQSRPLERELSLLSAVQEAISTNLELEISRRTVAAGAAQVRQAKSTLLPQVDLDANGAIVDDGLAGPFQSERTLTGTTTLSQVIYAAAWASYDIQKSLQQSRRHERERLRLDIAQQAATAYLNVLRAKTFERVQKDNLQLTRSNLELARVRRQIGVSGPAEVYRWESQMAIVRNSAIQANTQRNVAEIVLNQVLHRPLEESFATREIGLHDESLVTHDPSFIRFIDNKRNFGVFRSFMVKESLGWSPELRALDASIAAQERSLQAADRASYVPTVALRAAANWTLGVNASLPLYSGGGKFARARQASEELERLRTQRQAVAERVEQRMRVALHVGGAAYAGIGLSDDAAVAAHKNLQLVKDAYERDLHRGLDDSLMLINHATKTRIEVIKHYGELPLATCFSGRINQVFLNILNNAQQAIEGTGQITITTSAITNSGTTSSGTNEVRIAIADNGVGIDPERIGKIFDAGYTTKAVGMGTGLGLSICYQIVEDHNGRIEVDSAPGQGSTFTIVLPSTPVKA